MKKKLQLIAFVFTLTAIQFSILSVKGQCTWHTKIFDSFEYTTPCPDIIAGTTYGTTPQTYVHHSGARALYMNFQNGALCPAGTMVYSRTISVCPNIPVRVSTWLTETNGAVRCDLKVKITDANNVVLDSVASISPPAVHTWVQYLSPSLTPTTSTIKFIIITNLAGSAGGNDAGMDDFFVEECNSLNLGNDTTVCRTATVNLDAGSGYTSYVWNNSTTLQSLTASTVSPGTTTSWYAVTVTTPNSCSFNDSIKVVFDVCNSVNNLITGNQISVYPNPAADMVTIQNETPLNNSYFILYDAIGREAFRTKIENTFQRISLSSINNGIYFYTIYDGNRLKNTGKLVVVRNDY